MAPVQAWDSGLYLYLSSSKGLPKKAFIDPQALGVVRTENTLAGQPQPSHGPSALPPASPAVHWSAK